MRIGPIRQRNGAFLLDCGPAIVPKAPSFTCLNITVTLGAVVLLRLNVEIFCKIRVVLLKTLKAKILACDACGHH